MKISYKYFLFFLLVSVPLKLQSQNQWRVFTTQNSPLPGKNVLSISIDPNNTKWIGTDSGLVELSGNLWTIYDTNNSQIPFMNVSHNDIDDEGNVWLGSYSGGGIAKYDGVNWTIFNSTNSGLPYNTILSICVERGYIKWIGTSFGKVARFNDTTWRVYSTSDFGITNVFWRINIENHIKWFGMYSAGVIRFNDTNYIHYTWSNSGLPSDYIMEIELEQSQYKWFATMFGGLAKFNYPANQWTVYNSTNSGLPLNHLTDIQIDRYNKKYIGINGGGLVIFNDTTWTYYTSSNSPLPGNVYCIAIDSLGNKWIGTSFGLAVFNENGIIGINNEQSVVPKNFRLHQNYPNPFNSSTVIKYELSENSYVELRIYDVNGKLITELTKGEQKAGIYTLTFEAEDLSSGIYFYEMKVNYNIETKKMILVR